jgi:hypothetical protein
MERITFTSTLRYGYKVNLLQPSTLHNSGQNLQIGYLPALAVDYQPIGKGYFFYFFCMWHRLTVLRSNIRWNLYFQIKFWQFQDLHLEIFRYNLTVLDIEPKITFKPKNLKVDIWHLEIFIWTLVSVFELDIWNYHIFGGTVLSSENSFRFLFRNPTGGGSSKIFGF